MKKKYINLTDEEIERIRQKHCSEYIQHYCYGCPLDINGSCYNDLKEKLDDEIEVEDE